MVAYSFKKQFAEAILDGRKRQTIRGDRKRHARPGETIQLFTGMRTKQCRKIGEATCASATRITLHLAGNLVAIEGRGGYSSKSDLNAFARSDGFADWESLKTFWDEVHRVTGVWRGVLIEWRDFKPA